ncbi:hypothetical protein BVC80_1117g80 [Macleaya cordata]|uniref:Netrin receptor DCC n=1 Tax=Macleaya cordata TaxID=56857 RepID=A0A200Q9E4_MACCD|nr:hypothetical protein BVC80_1117g80 [Macleaya cordata]
MPTFTAISLDSLLDRGAPKSVVQNNSKLEKKRAETKTDKKIQRRQQRGVSPLLYATPEKTLPLPDSPSSFPPSPYIINHKRRGPRLLKSVSHEPISVVHQPLLPTQGQRNVIDENGRNPDSIGEFSFTSAPVSIPIEKEVVVGSSNNGFHDGDKVGSSNGLDDGLGKTEDLLPNSVGIKLDRDYEFENFFEPQESMSFTSNNTEVAEDNNGGERSFKLTSPMGEFFDAYEELSSEGGPPSSLQDVEAQLHEIRLNLLMEIEKRKQAEEALNNMQTHWQLLQHHLSVVGLKLPAASTIAAEDVDLNFDPAEDLCQQIHIARVVSDSIGRGSAKAVVEMEMESRIESKNFEIARLWDRLHYYEVVNQEMSQRNQEAIEMARRLRNRRKRRQKWVWSSIGAAITLGTAALVWSYNSSASGSSSTNLSDAPSGDDISKP